MYRMTAVHLVHEQLTLRAMARAAEPETEHPEFVISSERTRTWAIPGGSGTCKMRPAGG
jgi:hypothetical protein